MVNRYRDCFRAVLHGSSVVPRSYVKDILYAPHPFLQCIFVTI
jgi:hypothetical protein